jgi:hypothetical protein
LSSGPGRQQLCCRVDSNKSGTITPKELQAALVNGNNTEFNMVTIDSMISRFIYILDEKSQKLISRSRPSGITPTSSGLFDTDKTGEICFKEFGALWRYVVDWQNCFKTFDK